VGRVAGLERIHVTALAGGVGLALLAAAILLADADAAAGRPPLATLTAWVAPLASLGGAIVHAIVGATWATRLLWLLAALGLAAFSLRDRTPDAPLRLVAALALGFAAQALGMAGLVGGALLLYSAAAGLWCWRRAPTAPPGRSRWSTPALWLVALTVFAALALRDLDVHPGLHFDELAYLQAGHMWRGALEPGPIETPLFAPYTYERFRAQPIPLAIHGLALSALHPGFVALRLASVVAGAIGLWIAALALRRSCGDAVASWTLVLAAASPLALYYDRTGFYIAASILHGVLCFAATARFARRGDAGSAVALGVLLGIGLYLYQLSWFAPAIVVLGLGIAGRDALRRSDRGALAWGCAAALVTAIPLLGLSGPLRALAAQTIGKVPAIRADAPALSGALVLLPESADAEDAERLRAITLAHAPNSRLQQSRRGRRVLLISGPSGAVDSALDALEDTGATLLAREPESERLFAGAPRALRQLFFAPHVSFVSHLVDVPIVNPLLAPLLVLGAIEAWRRRREPGPRLLLVWCGAAVLLPTAVTDSLPRRLVLALPWLYALMALAFVALAAALARKLPAARRLALPASALVAVLAWSSGAHLFFAHWYDRFGAGVRAPDGLVVVRAAKAAAPDGAVGLLPALARHRSLIERHDPGRFAQGPRRVLVAANTSADTLRRASCEAGLPLHWIGPDRPEVALGFGKLEEHFTVRISSGNGLRVAVVERALPGACASDVRSR
jgi:hypothetical protein